MRHSTCLPPMPMPTAASFTAGLTAVEGYHRVAHQHHQAYGRKRDNAGHQPYAEYGHQEGEQGKAGDRINDTQVPSTGVANAAHLLSMRPRGSAIDTGDPHDTPLRIKCSSSRGQTRSKCSSR